VCDQVIYISTGNVAIILTDVVSRSECNELKSNRWKIFVCLGIVSVV
jgi:hypothetical protein